MKMPKLRNGSKEDLNPGSLDCEHGILPLIHRAAHALHTAVLKSWANVQEHSIRDHLSNVVGIV